MCILFKKDLLKFTLDSFTNLIFLYMTIENYIPIIAAIISLIPFVFKLLQKKTKGFNDKGYTFSYTRFNSTDYIAILIYYTGIIFFIVKFFFITMILLSSAYIIFLANFLIKPTDVTRFDIGYLFIVTFITLLIIGLSFMAFIFLS